MTVTLLGTGCPPPNPRRRGPATLVQAGDERFLVDAGSGVGAQLVAAGVAVVTSRVSSSPTSTPTTSSTSATSCSRAGSSARTPRWPSSARPGPGPTWTGCLRSGSGTSRYAAGTCTTASRPGRGHRDRGRTRLPERPPDGHRFRRGARAGQAGLRVPHRGRRPPRRRLGGDAAVREPGPSRPRCRRPDPRVHGRDPDAVDAGWAGRRARRRCGTWRATTGARRGRPGGRAGWRRHARPHPPHAGLGAGRPRGAGGPRFRGPDHARSPSE